MAANYIYEPIVHVQVAPISTIDIDHNFGRRVNVAVYNENGVQIYPYIEEIGTGLILNKVRISFYERSIAYSLGNWKAVLS